MGIGSNIGKALLAQAPDMAPGAAVSMLRSILGFAIDGASSLPGARQAAGKTLTKHDGDVEQAIEQLLEAFRRDRDWNEGAAKAQLLTIFDSLKPNDPLVQKGRRRLSSMIFA